MSPILTRPERLWVGMVLATVGGFLDAYTYVSRGVFATAQTGNVVLLAIDAANGRWDRIAAHLPPVWRSYWVWHVPKPPPVHEYVSGCVARPASCWAGRSWCS